MRILTGKTAHTPNIHERKKLADRSQNPKPTHQKPQELYFIYQTNHTLQISTIKLTEAFNKSFSKKSLRILDGKALK